MTTIEISAMRGDLAREILNTDDIDVLSAVKEAYHKALDSVKRRRDIISKKEIISGLEESLHEVKLIKEGKLPAQTAEDFLNELR
ncbi:MAG: hypothetical protein K5854_02770 [Prevotella sp.]|nr:hypothetical protein [Prevotella sp.]